MAKAKFSKAASNFGSRMAKRVDDVAGGPVGFDIVTIATLFLNLLPQVMQLFALCKKQPPTPPPVPQPLADAGVTEETWKQACGAKFAAAQCKGKHEEFSKISLKKAAAEIAKSKHIKKKDEDAKAMALASLRTARDEPVEEIATAMQQAKDNKADLDV